MKKARKARPPVPRRSRTPEELRHAETLRPRDLFVLYGLGPSAVHELCTKGDEFGVLPSVLIGAKSGRKGIRLVRRTDIETFLAARQVNAPAA